jgi:beta-glucanase (GH16 family)
VLPKTFAPVANYANRVENFTFGGSSLPSPWSAGLWNYGYQATQFQPSQVTTTGSSVALTAVKQTSPEGYPYMSGWISTSGAYTFKYGMVDFRAKMPAGQGLWSGLWMVSPSGSSPNTEIDVQEMLLGDTNTVYGSLHNWGPTPYWTETHSTRAASDLSAGFHDYQVIWQPGMLTWAVDGVAYAQYTEAQALAAGQGWPFDRSDVYLIADLAVAAASEWGGAPNAQTAFPASMQIQSVEIWQ